MLLDPERFKAVYGRSLPFVSGYFVRRVGGSAVLAADLTQETIISAVQTLQRGAYIESSAHDLS
jgi:DNA-directed RNA polymerase specialized sigma24 family protein